LFANFTENVVKNRLRKRHSLISFIQG